MVLFAIPISKSFLNSLGQELSGYMVLSSGKSFFASLDFREVWPGADFSVYLGRDLKMRRVGYKWDFHLMFFFAFLSYIALKGEFCPH